MCHLAQGRARETTSLVCIWIVASEREQVLALNHAGGPERELVLVPERIGVLRFVIDDGPCRRRIDVIPYRNRVAHGVEVEVARLGVDQGIGDERALVAVVP